MLLVPMLVANLCIGAAIAQDRVQSTQSKTEASGGHEPPPQAYEDCKGKKSGEAVQHTTREGKVAATCVDSPKGLVARPSQPKGAQPEVRVKQPGDK
jgi:hypothetical protein